MTFVSKLNDLVKMYRTSTEVCFSLTDFEINQIYESGVQHGLFDEINFGFHDKKNSVYSLIGTLFDIDLTPKRVKLFDMTVEEISCNTENAYSRGRYRSWNSCIKALQKAKYNDYQIQAILMSKIMRWAADGSNHPNKASSNDLMKYLSNTGVHYIEQITKETFPEYTGIN